MKPDRSERLAQEMGFRKGQLWTSPWGSWPIRIVRGGKRPLGIYEDPHVSMHPVPLYIEGMVRGSYRRVKGG